LGGLEVLTSLTTDSGKILAKLHAVQPAGKLKFVSGLKIALLVGQFTSDVQLQLFTFSPFERQISLRKKYDLIK
jgi:hypothetical protein